MTEEQKKQVATFRFGVIHELVNTKELCRGERERLIREKCERRWSIPFSNKTRIGRTTILRWLRLYKAGNGKIESLLTSGRSDRGASRSMDEETCLSPNNDLELDFQDAGSKPGSEAKSFQCSQAAQAGRS
jgi:hypothetical protein